MNLKIRTVEVEDIEAVLELKRGSMGPVWEDAGISYDDESLRKFLQDRFVNDRMIVAVDDDDGRLVGFLHSTTFEGVVSSKKIREIFTLAVHPDHFGEGIGKELMENERKNAKAEGVDIVRLEVLSENKRAIDFYDKQDFTEKKKILIKKLYSDQD